MAELNCHPCSRPLLTRPDSVGQQHEQRTAVKTAVRCSCCCLHSALVRANTTHVPLQVLSGAVSTTVIMLGNEKTGKSPINLKDLTACPAKSACHTHRLVFRVAPFANRQSQSYILICISSPTFRNSPALCPIDMAQ